MNGGLCTNILGPRDNGPPKLLPELVFAVNWGAIGEYWADGGNPTYDKLPPGLMLLMVAYEFSNCVNWVGAGDCGGICPDPPC